MPDLTFTVIPSGSAGTFIALAWHWKYPWPAGAIIHRLFHNEAVLEVGFMVTFGSWQGRGVCRFLHEQLWKHYVHVERFITDAGTDEGKPVLRKLGYRWMGIGWELTRPQQTIATRPGIVS